MKIVFIAFLVFLTSIPIEAFAKRELLADCQGRSYRHIIYLDKSAELMRFFYERSGALGIEETFELKMSSFDVENLRTSFRNEAEVFGYSFQIGTKSRMRSGKLMRESKGSVYKKGGFRIDPIHNICFFDLDALGFEI